jgi:hypothetical protein
MKAPKRQFLLALSLLGLLNPLLIKNSFAKSSFFISSWLINLYVLNQSPVVKKLLFLQLSFLNPHLDFSKKEQRIFLTCDVEVLLPQQSPIKGLVSLNSSFVYDPVRYQIFLKDPQLTSFTLDVFNAQENQIIGQLSPIIGNLFNGLAIYTLTAQDIKMLRRAPSSILIEDGGIRFYYD